MLTSHEAISCIVGANGDVKLAAVRARAFDPTATEPLLLTIIAADPSAPSILYRQIQVLMALSAFSSLKQVQHAFLEKIPMMSPDTIARTYTNMLKSLSDMTASAAVLPQEDPIRRILSALPPDVADAVERLMADQPQANLEHQTDTMSMLSSSNPATPDSGCEAVPSEAIMQVAA